VFDPCIVQNSDLNLVIPVSCWILTSAWWSLYRAEFWPQLDGLCNRTEFWPQFDDPSIVLNSDLNFMIPVSFWILTSTGWSLYRAGFWPQLGDPCIVLNSDLNLMVSVIVLNFDLNWVIPVPCWILTSIWRSLYHAEFWPQLDDSCNRAEFWPQLDDRCNVLNCDKLSFEWVTKTTTNQFDNTRAYENCRTEHRL